MNTTPDVTLFADGVSLTAYREPLYHEGAFAEQLPAKAVIALVRRVIEAAIKS